MIHVYGKEFACRLEDKRRFRAFLESMNFQFNRVVHGVWSKVSLDTHSGEF